MSAFKLWKWQGSEFGLDRGNGNGEPSVFWKQAVSESTVPRRKRLTLCGSFLARVLSVLHTHLPSSFDLRGENDFRKAFFSLVYFPFLASEEFISQQSRESRSRNRNESRKTERGSWIWELKSRKENRRDRELLQIHFRRGIDSGPSSLVASLMPQFQTWMKTLRGLILFCGLQSFFFFFYLWQIETIREKCVFGFRYEFSEEENDAVKNRP